MAEIKNMFFWRAVLAEFLGMTLFIYVLVGTTVTLSPNVGSTIIRIALGIGLTIAVLAQTFGPISGGHFNPAVTLAMATTRKITILKAVFYMIAQFAGGITGAAICFALTPSHLRGAFATVSIDPSLTVAQGFFVELILTFILVLVIFASTDSKRNPVNGFGSPLAIGITVAICHLTGIPYTGSSINPARAFATALVMNVWPTYHWIYWLGPFVGGVLAGLMYLFIFEMEDKVSPGLKPSEQELDAVVTVNLQTQSESKLN